MSTLTRTAAAAITAQERVACVLRLSAVLLHQLDALSDADLVCLEATVQAGLPTLRLSALPLRVVPPYAHQEAASTRSLSLLEPVPARWVTCCLDCGAQTMLVETRGGLVFEVDCSQPTYLLGTQRGPHGLLQVLPTGAYRVHACWGSPGACQV